MITTPITASLQRGALDLEPTDRGVLHPDPETHRTMATRFAAHGFSAKGSFA